MSSPVAHIFGGLTILEADRRHFGGKDIHRGWRWTVFCALLGCLPDIDNPLVRFFGQHVAFMNIADGWGPRRGMTHTLLFAAAVSLACMAILRLTLRQTMRDIRRHGILIFSAVTSHLAMDVLTGAGNGMPFFWPISDARFMSPWPLLPVSPYRIRMAGWMAIVTSPAVYFTVIMEFVIVGSAYLFVRSQSRNRFWWLAVTAIGMGVVYISRTYGR